MCAVGGAKSIIHPHGAEFGQLLGKGRIASLFFFVKAKIFEQQDLAWLRGGGRSFGNRACAFGRKGEVPSRASKAGTMWRREYLSSGPPFGLPRWLIRMAEPPSANIFLMVGIAALRRVSSVTAKALLRGTLKSTRIRAF